LAEYPDPHALLPLNEIILKACHADSRKRFQSAAEMHNALSRLQSGMSPAVQLLQSEPDKKSVAVLPFVNMNADADNEFLSDGITEDLTTALAQVKGLRVAGRTSAFSFKGKAKDLRKIASQLGVEAIVEGSLRKVGNRLRITAQLINAADGCHVWSERYDRDLSDVFSLQDEISKAIVEALKLRLVADSPALLVKPQTTSMDAYQLYLKGRYFWNQRAAGLPKGCTTSNWPCWKTRGTRWPTRALQTACICSASMATSAQGSLSARQGRRDESARIGRCPGRSA